MEPSDEALIQACRQGNADAWQLLVERYQRLVYAVPRRAGLDDELAAEVFQRVFAHLVRKLNDIDRPERLSAWLTTLARRESWRVIQQQKRIGVPASADNDWYERADAAALPPDADLIAIEEQHLVRQALATLDERCAHLLTLLYYQPEPPPYSEIAQAIGTTTGSVGPTRARCLQKLKQQLDMLGF